jgi:non-heme chloroperoxidase
MIVKKSKIVILVATILLLVSCGNKPEKLPNHVVKHIKISDEVSLEVLDWGGNRTPILFLAGLSNTAHIFDDFAPRFTDKFHVYALTRRGFGSSSQPKDGYDLETLTRDIISVIDNLNLKKVILAGHSLAGEEITKIASDYPDRIEKIIYLDAAYDRTEMMKMFAYMPEFPKATAADSTSFQAQKKYMEKINGISLPDEELQEMMIFAEDGKYLKDVVTDSIMGLLYGISVKPNYERIKCPSLAIYASRESARNFFSFYESLDSINKIKANQTFELWRKYEMDEPERFSKESKNGIVKKIKGHHYIFLSNPDETEKLMRDFLE